MYQVTAMYGDDEVGYGEGEGYEYAARECAESVSEMYPASEVLLVCTHGVIQMRTPLDIWQEFAA